MLAFIEEVLPDAPPKERTVAADVVMTSMAAIGKRITTERRTRAEIDAWAEVVVDMQCGYLERLGRGGKGATRGQEPQPAEGSGAAARQHGASSLRRAGLRRADLRFALHLIALTAPRGVTVRHGRDNDEARRAIESYRTLPARSGQVLFPGRLGVRGARPRQTTCSRAGVSPCDDLPDEVAAKGQAHQQAYKVEFSPNMRTRASGS